MHQNYVGQFPPSGVMIYIGNKCDGTDYITRIIATFMWDVQ